MHPTPRALSIAVVSLAVAASCGGGSGGDQPLLDRARAAMTRPGQVLYLEGATEHRASPGSDGLIRLDPPSRYEGRLWLDVEGERQRSESESKTGSVQISLLVDGMVYQGKPSAQVSDGTPEVSGTPLEELQQAFGASFFPWGPDAGWRDAGQAEIDGRQTLLLEARSALGCPQWIGCEENGEITAVSTVYLDSSSLLPYRTTLRWLTERRGEFELTSFTVTSSSFIAAADLPADFFSPESLSPP